MKEAQDFLGMLVSEGYSSSGPQLRLKGGYADLEWEDDFD